MKTINLRKLYFSQYHEDVFVVVSDEVAENRGRTCHAKKMAERG